MSDTLLNKISSRSATVGVIGLGYVGLPLAVALARSGFHVVGLEIDTERVAAINRGSSYIEDVTTEELSGYVRAGQLAATTDYAQLKRCDAVFICVPTPYTTQRTPDLSAVTAASEGIAAHLQRGQLIVLQSTTFPGTTNQIVRPILEGKSGLSAQEDFYLAFSPERIDPGNKQWTAYNTPKVVGGATPEATKMAAALLRQMGTTVHEVSSPEVAELTKLLENTFRAVNIALVNEMAQLAERMEIDIWEVLEAARTKPFGYMSFQPGPGVGGHCIPIDPYYLLWKAKEYDFYTRFIELAAETNETMPYHVVELTTRALNLKGQALQGARILILGVAFKPNIRDARNSPADRVIELLLKGGAHITYHDPHVPVFTVGGDVFLPNPVTLHSVPLDQTTLAQQDAVVIVTGHEAVDYAQVVAHASLVVDTCNATHKVDRAANGSPKGPALIVKLGAPLPDLE